MTRSDRVRMPRFPPLFFLTIVVVHNLPLRMTGSSMATGCDVTKSHVTPKEFPWKGGVRTCTTGSCTLSAQVGPFHRKDGVHACTIFDQRSPVGLPLENMGARMHDRKCPWGMILFVLKPNPKED
jgi:hypothetical protein